jgi:DNA-directed RNA polymerase specialized sigma24 family protein
MADAEKTRAGFDEVVSQARATNILLTALLARSGEFKQQDIIVLLARARLGSAEIAAITGTTINTVQVTMSRRRTMAKKRENERE